jgi:hypothetical protein
MSEVYITGSAIKIAKLGYDGATETDLRNMVLDTSRGKIIGTFIAPTLLNMSNFSLEYTRTNSNLTTKSYSNSISFGKTFAKPPAAMVFYKSTHFSGWMPYFFEAAVSLVSSGSGVTAAGGQTMAGYGVTTSGITFFYFQLTYATNPTTVAPPTAIAYFISQG